MKKILLLLAVVVCSLQAAAIDLYKVRFHNEATDTVRINDILIDAKAKKLAPGALVAEIGRQFIDVPYVGHTLEGAPEMLTVNVDELDCTTFVETVLAMAMTVESNRSSWRDFLYSLESIRYRQGVMDGYPSRLHYNSDWIIDNSHRGNLEEVTTLFPTYHYQTRTLDFMTQNADKYEALADSANLAGIKNVELGYFSHRFPYIKSVDFNNKAVKAKLREGDILGFVTNIKNLDVAHLGIVVMVDGEPHVLHASSSEGKVVLTKATVGEFLKKNRQFLGARVYRLKHN